MIYHQILFLFDSTKDIPEKEKEILNEHLHKFCKNIPYMLWTFERAIEFMSMFYPQFLPLMHLETEFNIVKCDFFRYLIMYHYGGIYTDLDFIIIKDLHSFIKDVVSNKVIFFPIYNKPNIILSEEWLNSLEQSSSIHNGILVSLTIKHPFWLTLIFDIFNDLCIQKRKINTKEDVYNISGPRKLASMFQHYTSFNDVVLLPYFYFCPYTAIIPNTNEKKIYNNSIIHGSITNEEWSFFNIHQYKELSTICPLSYFVCVYLGDGSMWKT
jgi:hypothetical protein